MLTNSYVENQVLIDPVLAIKTSSSPIVKSTNATLYTNRGGVYTKAAGDMSALTGTIATAYTGVYTFQIDSAGTITTLKGTDALTADGVTLANFPSEDASKTTLGSVVIVNATGSTFTGGTTALDTASLTVYYTNKHKFGK
jgi:hypothetical protein